MIFKEKRIEYEFNDLTTGGIDPKLRAVMLYLDWWCNKMFKKEIVVTCLNRTKEENDAVGGMKYSAHLSGRGCDFRSWIFTGGQIEALVKHIAYVFKDMVYIKYHTKGTGPHIHMNIRLNYSTGIEGYETI